MSRTYLTCPETDLPSQLRPGTRHSPLTRDTQCRVSRPGLPHRSPPMRPPHSSLPGTRPSLTRELFLVSRLGLLRTSGLHLSSSTLDWILTSPRTRSVLSVSDCGLSGSTVVLVNSVPDWGFFSPRASTGASQGPRLDLSFPSRLGSPRARLGLLCPSRLGPPGAGLGLSVTSVSVPTVSSQGAGPVRPFRVRPDWGLPERWACRVRPDWGLPGPGWACPSRPCPSRPGRRPSGPPA